MDGAAGFFDLGGVGFEVEIQVRQSVVLDVAGGVAQRFEFRHACDRRGTARDEAGAAAGEGFLQAGIAQGLVGVFLEGGGGGDMHGWFRLDALH